LITLEGEVVSPEVSEQRRLSVGRVLAISALTAVAIACLALSGTFLSTHPKATRTDLYGDWPLSERDCGNVLSLLINGSQEPGGELELYPDKAWDESCMEQVPVPATIGIASATIAAAAAGGAVVLALRRPRRVPRAG
jgi:hypothetical protein